MSGHKTHRGKHRRDKRGRAARTIPPSSRPDRLAGLIGVGAVGALAGGMAVGFAAIPGSGQSVPAARHDIQAATTSGSARHGAVLLAETVISPSPSATPTPTPTSTGGNDPVPTTTPTATPSPTPGDPDDSAPLPTPTPTPTPTKTSTSGGSTSGKTSGKKNSTAGKKTSTPGPSDSALSLGELNLGTGSVGDDTPLVDVPGFAPVDPTGLFPTVSPGSGSSPAGKGKRIDAVTTAATTPLDTLIPGQAAGLAVLVGAIALAFIRFSLRTPQPSSSPGKASATSEPGEPE